MNNKKLATQKEMDRTVQSDSSDIQNHEIYCSLIDYLPGVVYRCKNDQHWSLSYISAQVINLTGYDTDIFYKANSGINLDPVIHPEDRQMAREKVQIALTKKEPYELIYRILTANGAERWILEKGAGIYSDNGDLLFLEGFIMDSTERIKADQDIIKNEKKLRIELEELVRQRTEELRTHVNKLEKSNTRLGKQIEETRIAEAHALSSQSLFSTIAKNFPKGIIAVMDLDFRFVFAEGEELARMGLDKLVRKGVSMEDINIFSEDQTQKIKENISRTLSGEHCTFEMQYKNSTYMINTSPLYDDNNNIVQALLVNSNISGQKQVELKIMNALKKEQELNELKSRFVSMASHEFRTPLSTILSSATLISKQNDPGLEEKREKYVRNIKSNVRNMVAILEDFLSLGKLDEGKTTILPTTFDLIDFTKSLVEEIETGKKNGQIIKLTTDRSKIEVSMDEKLIRHILVNLLSNAIKYSSEDDTILLNIYQGDDTIDIKVTDYGIGIPKAEQANLFDRFFRARNATNIKGTGLGLHIVKKYVDIMEGTIDFKSELDRGTTFSLTLPIKQNSSEKDITY
mgnify:CR=1 FL=1|tara:strand:- start:89579 stop:91297 length:1719 start_codon:yes stop_codon:yes gene_type:complete